MIRNAKPEDVVDIQRIYRHYVENTVISFEYVAPSVEELEKRIQHYQKNYPYLVLEKREESSVTPMGQGIGKGGPMTILLKYPSISIKPNSEKVMERDLPWNSSNS